MIRRYVPKNMEELAAWYMRYISPLALIAGFFADNLTNNKIRFYYIILVAQILAKLTPIKTPPLRFHSQMKILAINKCIISFCFLFHTASIIPKRLFLYYVVRR